MPKFEIYEPKPEDEPVLFKLEKNHNGVRLIVCDSEGKRCFAGDILQINHDGGLHRFRDVNESFGLKLNEAKQIVTN